MVAPLLPELAIAPLRAIDAASLTAVAQKWTEISVRQPGAVYVTTKDWGPAIPARMNPLALDAPLRGDQPSSSRKWHLAFETGTAVKAGDQWRFQGTTNGEAWSRIVLISEVEFPASDELTRRAIGLDAATNP